MGLFSSKPDPPPASPPSARNTVERKPEGLKSIDALDRAITDKDQERKALSFYRKFVIQTESMELIVIRMKK